MCDLGKYVYLQICSMTIILVTQQQTNTMLFKKKLVYHIVCKSKQICVELGVAKNTFLLQKYNAVTPCMFLQLASDTCVCFRVICEGYLIANTHGKKTWNRAVKNYVLHN